MNAVPICTDHDRFDYSAIVDRAPLRWPGAARVALWVVPNIEHYEYLPAQVRVRDPWPRTPHPDVLGYGQRDYGNRVGLWRMMEVLDRHQVRCTTWKCQVVCAWWGVHPAGHAPGGVCIPHRAIPRNCLPTSGHPLP